MSAIKTVISFGAAPFGKLEYIIPMCLCYEIPTGDKLKNSCWYESGEFETYEDFEKWLLSYAKEFWDTAQGIKNSLKE